MLGNFEKLLKQVDNRARFLSGVLSGEINCINRKKDEQRQEFVEKGFDPLPKDVQPVVVVGVRVKKETAERSDVVGASDYDYLTSMSVSSLTEEYLHHLLELKRRLEIKVRILRKAAPQCLKSEKEPTLLGTCKKAQLDRDVMVDMPAKDSQVSEAAPNRQRKRTAAESLEASPVLMDDDEEAPELKDESQEHTETECSEKPERKGERKRRKKQRKESEDGYHMEKIKRIASGLDGIEITHCNTYQSIVAQELGKLSLRDASVSLCHEGVV